MNRDSNWRRLLALALLCERRLRDGYLGRAAAFYGWGVALSYGLLIPFAPGSSRVLVSQALMSLGGVVGTLVALAGARAFFATEPESDAVHALARETGTRAGELWAARVGALGWRFLKTAGRPALALGLLALVSTLLRGQA